MDFLALVTNVKVVKTVTSVKERSLGSNLVMYYFRDTQRDWIECLGQGHINKSANS